MATNDIYELRFQQRLAGQLVLNTFHFRAKTDAANAQNLCASWDAFVAASWSGLQTNKVNYELITAQPLVPFGGVGYATPPTTQTGATAAEALPGNVALCWSYITGQIGRSHRGRSFIAGISVQTISNGLFTNAVLAVFAEKAAALLALFGGAGSSTNWQIGVWSEKLGGKGPAATAAGFTPITGVRVAAIPASSYRRKPGVGR